MKTQPQNKNELDKQLICIELEICSGYAGLIIKSLNSLKVNIGEGLISNCNKLDKNSEFMIDCRDKQIPEMVIKAGVLLGALYHYYKKTGCNTKG